MPAFRNVANRHSGRLSKSTPVIYDEDGWEVLDATLPSSLPCLDVKPNHIKVEPLDDHALSPVSPSTASLPPGSSPSFSETSFSVEPRATSSSSASSAPAPSRKNSNSHSRRRDPSHIPRPRNAFILFRSDYIKQELAQGLADGHGQQNELSKHAGKVWNKMSASDKRPYAERAALEKEEHYRKYPNYVYAPGRNGSNSNAKARPGKRKAGGAVAGRGHATKKRKASVVSEEEDLSSSPGSPDMSPVMLPMRPQKTPRVAAQRAALKITQPVSPLPSLSPSIQHSPYSTAGGGCPSEDTKVKDEEMADDFAFSSPHSFFAGGDLDGYVPTSEIPLLELNPKQEEEPYTLYTDPMDYRMLPRFAVSPYSSYLDHGYAYTYGYGMNMGLGSHSSNANADAQDPTLPPLPQGTIIVDDDFAEFLNRRTQEEQNVYGTLDDMFPVLPAIAIGSTGAGAGVGSSTSQKDKNASSSASAAATSTTTTSSPTPVPASTSSSSSSSSALSPDIDPIFRWHPSPPPEIFPDFTTTTTYPFLESDSDVDAGVYQFFDLDGNHRY